jgi:hypothetical protein
MADNYNDITVAGLRKLSAKDYLSVVVSRNGGKQSTFFVNQNSAGFSACILDTAVLPACSSASADGLWILLSDSLWPDCGHVRAAL